MGYLQVEVGMRFKARQVATGQSATDSGQYSTDIPHLTPSASAEFQSLPAWSWHLDQQQAKGNTNANAFEEQKFKR